MIPFPRSLRPSGTEAYAFEVEADHPAFQGHFPDHPILPGVVQVDWAIRLGAERFGVLGAFQSLEHLKFQAVIVPEEPITLTLAWDDAARELAFTYRGADGVKSSGFARFA
ncbi:MAG: hydroxymyristoyl-ACP dehydratase [Acidobacteria bacterium]|nr:hydroxymyristoyl-ACP dehydratase [Acidobacteriota bacterium]